MGVHQVFSEIEAAAKLVGAELFGSQASAPVAGELAPPAKCTRTAGCELAHDHPDGCQFEGHFTPDAAKHCTVIENNVPGLRPGWLCCQRDCATFNDKTRTACKHCGHAPCMPKAAP